MGGSDRDVFLDAVDALGEAGARCVKLRPTGALTGLDWLAVLESLETVRCRLPAVEHELIAELGALAGPAELGGTLCHAVAGGAPSTVAVWSAGSHMPGAAPPAGAAGEDRRTRAQRNHDALNAGWEISHS